MLFEIRCIGFTTWRSKFSALLDQLFQRIKMSTRGGWIVEPENSQLSAAVKSGPEFPDTPGNPENPGKCPDIPACQGGIKFDRN
jgi:hypothetical protein